MTSRARASHALALPRGASSVMRLAPAAISGGLDAAAAALLIGSAPQPDAVAVAIAAGLHLAAAWLLASWPGRNDGRRLLGAATVLAIPCIGAVIAAAVLSTRGEGTAGSGLDFGRVDRSSPARPAVTRSEDLIPTCDALLDGDEERRRAALAGLTRRADPEGMLLLRWAARGDDPDLALLAALALDEIGERAPGRSRRGAAREVRHVAG
ncbi:MAG TPA: hypothetical protein VMQ62_14295 [Dongiaceae bacterium]|nr:hypothetical protein [Dongiaceae bacterium]